MVKAWEKQPTNAIDTHIPTHRVEQHEHQHQEISITTLITSAPPAYLLAVSRTIELSLQSSFQLSLTVLVFYRSHAVFSF